MTRNELRAFWTEFLVDLRDGVEIGWQRASDVRWLAGNWST